MFKSKIYILFSAVFILIATTVSAQEKDDLGTEVVNIVKPYTPTISDAFKVKETPILNDSVTLQKQPVTYSIFSVPVASTFTPAKGKATTVEKAKPIKGYDNYATLGFGNYTTILGELSSNFDISRTDNAGFYLRHNSSQGDIDGIRAENKYYDTQLDGNYTSRQKGATYRVTAGGEHQLFNWYGLPEGYNSVPDGVIADLDLQQTYFGGYLGGSIAIDDSFFDLFSAKVRYLGDSFSSQEVNVTAKPEFSFPIGDLSFEFDGELDYLSGSFDRRYDSDRGINYSLVNVGVLPALTFINNDLTVALGVGIFAQLDTQNSENDFFIYPNLKASYRLVDELLIAYGGVEGDLKQNSFYKFKQENPFVSPTLFIQPTRQQYNGFGGFKGKLSNSIGYNFRASYGKEENKALLKANDYKGRIGEYEGYERGNSFNVVYDDVNTLAIFGELKVEVNDILTLGVNGTYYSYDVTNEAEPWNLPDLEASLFSNFNITPKLYGSASFFYKGERTDELINRDPLVTAVPTNTRVTLDGYLDANVQLGYRITERFSVFAKGNNLLSDNYQKWVNYPVQGIQALLGATYKFDW